MYNIPALASGNDLITNSFTATPFLSFPDRFKISTAGKVFSILGFLLSSVIIPPLFETTGKVTVATLPSSPLSATAW